MAQKLRTSLTVGGNCGRVRKTHSIISGNQLHVERELRLADRFDKTEIGLLLKCDTFPAINESILKRYFTEIAENVIKVEVIITAVENRRTAACYRS